MKTSYFDSASYHIYCYFGDTNDLFVDETLLPMSMPEMLHRDLKRFGYERIIFFDYNQGAYFLDLESKHMMQGGKKLKTTAPVLKSAFSGKLLGASSAATQITPKPKESLSITVDPAEIVRYAGEFMADASIKTAVIFPDGLNMLEDMRLSGDNGSLLNNLFHQVSNIHEPTNRNVMILLFNRREKAVQDFFHEHKWDYIWESIKKHAVFHHIPPVSLDEIRLAIHNLRLVGIGGQTLQVDCTQIQEICQMIAGKIRRNINTEYTGQPYSTTGELTACQLKDLIRYLMDRFIIPGAELNLKSCQIMCAQKAQNSAMERLDQLIGMQDLKDTLRSYIKKYTGGTVQETARVLRLEPPVSAKKKHTPNLHFVLTGNPGTGKTTAAKLIGEVLAEYGLLPSGHMIETRPSKLIGEYVGQSESNMREVLELAKGGVLFIDEAYGFAPAYDYANNSFHEGIVNELVAHMTSAQEAFSVIMAGYPEDMTRMFETVNPGLKERFQNHVHIADYTPEELKRIFHLKAAQMELRVSPELDSILTTFFDNWYADCQDDWANGRNVENLLGDMVRNTDDVLTTAMVKTELQKYLNDAAQKSVREQLDAMIGLKNVKKTVKKFENKLRYGNQKKRNYHFVFAGNPGTGKTTVANLFGQLLKGASILKSGTINVVKAEDLLKSPDALAQAIQKSRNRVLFIDEAYQLLKAPHIIDQLVEKTNPDAVDFPFCAVCAGYAEDMDRFMEYNAGMDRRFDVIRFDTYTPDDLMQILNLVLRKNYPNFTVTEGFLQKTATHFQKYQETIAAKFNAGYIGKYIEEAESLLYEKFAEQYGEERPPAEAYVLDETTAPEHFCGYLH